MSAPFMQLYVADYLGDTQHLTTEQHGAYLLLLMTMWRQGGSLPADERTLARVARISPRRWHLIASEVMAFFDVAEGRVTQKRLVEEYQKAASKSEKRSACGKLGGEANSLKNKKTRAAIAKQKPEHLLQISEPDKGSSDPLGPPTPKDEQLAYNRWNSIARAFDLPEAQKLTDAREGKLTARLKECGGLAGWDAALAKVAASAFCTGRKTSFRADLDFLLQASSFQKLIEGSYDNVEPPRGGQHEQRNSHSSKPTVRDQIREGVRSAHDRGGLRGPFEAGGEGHRPDWSADEHPGGMAARTISLGRGEDGTYADREEHPRRYAGARH